MGGLLTLGRGDRLPLIRTAYLPREKVFGCFEQRRWFFHREALREVQVVDGMAKSSDEKELSPNATFMRDASRPPGWPQGSGKLSALIYQSISGRPFTAEYARSRDRV